jgi:hypothetical protein
MTVKEVRKWWWKATANSRESSENEKQCLVLSCKFVVYSVEATRDNVKKPGLSIHRYVKDIT